MSRFPELGSTENRDSNMSTHPDLLHLIHFFLRHNMNAMHL